MQDISNEPRLSGLDHELVGESVRFLADRALWWPRERTLFVADVHLGKAESFRALGVPVPSGPTRATLARLSSLVSACAATHLVVLGDLLHARAAQTEAVMTPFRDWRQAHKDVQITLVRGNHDDRAGDPPADLRIDVVNAPHGLGPFVLCHDDQDGREPGLASPLSGHRLEGHLHPAVRLSARAGRGVRLPCFCVSPQRTLLPAFGDFTGTALISPAPGESIWAIAGGQVLRVPNA